MFIFDDKLELNNLFDDFIKQSRNLEGKSVVTIKNYRNNFRLLEEFNHNLKLSDITPKLMVDFFEYLMNRQRKIGNEFVVRDLKNSSIATVRGKLSAFFTWLVENKYLELNPFVGIKFPDVSYTDKRAFTKDELDKIYLAVSRDISWENQILKKRNIALIMVLLLTGIRKGEILGLKLTDIDLKNRLLTVRAETSKSKRTRIVRINQELMSHIEEYLMVINDYTTKAFLVSSNKDCSFTEHGLKHLVNHLNEVTNINCHVHRFRHTFAVNYYNQTHDIIGLQRLMGHRDIKMTMSYLRSLSDDDVFKQMDMISVAKFR